MTSSYRQIESELTIRDHYFLRCDVRGLKVDPDTKAEYERIKQGFLRMKNKGPQSRSSQLRSPLATFFKRSNPLEAECKEMVDQLMNVASRLPKLHIVSENDSFNQGKYEPLEASALVPFRTWWRRLSRDQEESSVFSGETFDGVLLVLKVVGPSPFGFSKAEEREIQDEMLKRRQTLQHDNILRLLGTCYLFGRYHVVSSRVEYGNIMNYVISFPQKENTVILLRDVASAINYLHVDKRLIHGNIKPSNILVTGNVRALLCDFVMEQICSARPPKSIKVQRSFAYLPPEFFEPWKASEIQAWENAPETDIWALSMSMAQIIKKSASPWDSIVSETIMRDRLLVHNRRPSPPATFTHASDAWLWEIAVLCWERDVKRRIGIYDIITRLDSWKGLSE